MIEFTLSKVALCACGIAVLLSVTGFMTAVDDNRQSEMDVFLVNDIALMLDELERSQLDMTILDGRQMLPSPDHSLTVKNGVVTLYHGEKAVIAPTIMEGDFELGFGDRLVLERSVAEGLGDVPDGVGEDVHLLETVVQVDGCACTAVHSP